MPPAAPMVGLCADCSFHRVIESGRGSRFWLCQRSRFDPRFPRYPRLPVLACAGFQPLATSDPPLTSEPEPS